MHQFFKNFTGRTMLSVDRTACTHASLGTQTLPSLPPSFLDSRTIRPTHTPRTNMDWCRSADQRLLPKGRERSVQRDAQRSGLVRTRCARPTAVVLFLFESNASMSPLHYCCMIVFRARMVAPYPPTFSIHGVIYAASECCTLVKS